MGIHSLKTLLGLHESGNRSRNTKEEIPKGATLLIDGIGLLFHIITTHQAFELFKREFQGNYAALDVLIREEIKLLQSIEGINLIVYLDGKSRMKSATLEKRREKRERDWSALYNFCLDGEKANQNEFPLPPLCTRQFKMTLKSMQVAIRETASEADQEIAKACSEGNIGCPIGKERFFCCGTDSDFYAFRDCPYIQLSDLDISKQKGGLRGNVLAAKKVWRRKVTAASFNMTEEQFVEWCIYIGNDYTGIHPRSSFDPVLNIEDAEEEEEEEQGEILESSMDEEGGDIDGENEDVIMDAVQISPSPKKRNKKLLFTSYSPSTLMELRDHICSRPVGFHVSSSGDAELQRAIEFSRSLYELRDLSEYPFDDSSSTDELMRLSQAQKTRLLRAFNDQEGMAIQAGSYKSPLENINALMVALTGLVASSDPNYSSITRLHMIAFESMMQKVKLRTSSLGCTDLKSIAKKYEKMRPKWDDIVAANLFQNAFSEWFKNLEARVEKNPQLAHLLHEPKDIFDGYIFHEEVALLRARMKPSVTAVTSGLKAEGGAKTTTAWSSSQGTSESTVEASSEVAAEDATGKVENARETLPIDQHKDRIIEKIYSDRVVIIHGETGCGKSSRLPVILYEDAMSRNLPCKMMVSQPRRIAASSLMKRVRQSLGDKIGMRMGHGVKDESDETIIHFVTTGYIVRLLAHHPEAFESHSHLIIDEVHERSVDGDVLCLLARRLLETHPTIRIILMSATVHTELYKTYFTDMNGYRSYGDLECLSVGVRRFPVDIKYLDDLLSPSSGLPTFVTKNAEKILHLTKRSSGKMDEDVPQDLAKSQYSLVVNLVRAIGREGSGILVFVSGITDITELTEQFEGLSRYKVFAIHSEIPFEEQEAAFLPAGPNEVKVIFATNAAESSITLPDVDCVICLGTHKAMRYLASSHRVQLANTWISRASATQRAGRTGRVRPGLVYRLYSRTLHDSFQDHEISEVHRTPLQDVILNLRTMFDESPGFAGVIPLLEELLEPPEMGNVEKSFEYLHNADMLTSPDDDGDLTALGRFAGHLPVDLNLSRLVALGISMGIMREAIVIAASFAQPKSLFRIASPLIHNDPDEFNDICKTTFLGAARLDGGCYSLPIMYLRAFIEYTHLPGHAKDAWLRRHGLVSARFKQFLSTTFNLYSRVQSVISSSQSSSFKNRFNKHINHVAKEDTPTLEDMTLADLDKAKLNMIRLLLAWTSDGNYIRVKNRSAVQSAKPSTLHTMAIVTPMQGLTHAHFAPLFPKEVNWRLEMSGRRMYDGHFSAARISHNLEELLRDMVLATMGSVFVPLVWVLDKKRKVMIVVRINPDICEAVTNGPNSGEVQDEIGRVMDIFGPRLQAQGDLFLQDPSTTSHSHHHSDEYRKNVLGMIFYCVDPSKKEQTRMNELHEDLNGSLSMTIPEIGTPKLIAKNFIPTRYMLERIFWAEEADEEVNDGNGNGDGGDFDSSGVKTTPAWRRISEQVNNCKQQLVFDPPSSTSVSGPPSTPSSSAQKSSSKPLKGGGNSESEIPDSDTATAVPPLIKDLPLGYRLVNLIKNGYKDKCIFLWKEPKKMMKESIPATAFTASTPDSKGNVGTPASGSVSASASPAAATPSPSVLKSIRQMIPTKVLLKSKDSLAMAVNNRTEKNDAIKSPAPKTPSTPVIGSAEWHRLKTQGKLASPSPSSMSKSRPDDNTSDPNRWGGGDEQYLLGNNQEDDVENEKMAVVLSAVKTEWEYVRCGGFTDVPTRACKALLPRQSVPCVATHCGNGVVYGATHNTLEIRIATGGCMMNCEHVTLFPPGSRWFTLALLCMDSEPNDIIVFPERRGGNRNDEDDYIDAGITVDEEFECEGIYYLIKQSCNSAIGINTELIGRISSLFCDWTDYVGDLSIPAIFTQKFQEPRLLSPFFGNPRRDFEQKNTGDSDVPAGMSDKKARKLLEKQQKQQAKQQQQQQQQQQQRESRNSNSRQLAQAQEVPKKLTKREKKQMQLMERIRRQDSDRDLVLGREADEHFNALEENIFGIAGDLLEDDSSLDDNQDNQGKSAAKGKGKSKKRKKEKATPAATTNASSATTATTASIYECDICEKVFLHTFQLNQHMASKHNQQQAGGSQRKASQQAVNTSSPATEAPASSTPQTQTTKASKASKKSIATANAAAPAVTLSATDEEMVVKEAVGDIRNIKGPDAGFSVGEIVQRVKNKSNVMLSKSRTKEILQKAVRGQLLSQTSASTFKIAV